MSIIAIAKELVASVGAVEIAEEETEIVVNESMTGEEQLIVYLNAVILRSDKILDKNKPRIFSDVLSLNTRGDVERALTAYNKHFLLSLPLSLDTIVELTKELITLAAKYQIDPPKDWKNISKYDVGMVKSSINLINRKKAGI